MMHIGLACTQVTCAALRELERSLPSGEWRGPSELECRLRVMDIDADLLRVARLLEIAARESD